MGVEQIIILITAVFGSAGFWSFLNSRLEKRRKNKSSEAKMLLGLGHDRIYDLCKEYIKEGHISTNEYDNLMYLYAPYKELGGNGTAERLMEAVKKLPVVEE